MDEFLFITDERDSTWWFLMSPAQKRQHLFVDSNVEDKHIDLIMKVYDEEAAALYEEEA